MAEVGIAAKGTVVAKAGGLPTHQKLAAVAAVVVAPFSFAVVPFGAKAFVAALLVGTLVLVSATDIRRGVIPNRIVVPAMAIILVVRLAFFPGRGAEWIAAGILAGVVLYLPRLLNTEAIGMGDIKLAMLIGFALGWGAALAIPAAFVCVFPAALVVVARGGIGARTTTLPFGPFLALGALIVLFAPYVAGLPAN